MVPWKILLARLDFILEYYSAIKRNEIGSSVETWVDLETVIQRENKYVLTYVESEKIGMDDLIYKIET